MLFAWSVPSPSPHQNEMALVLILKHFLFHVLNSGWGKVETWIVQPSDKKMSSFLKSSLRCLIELNVYSSLVPWGTLPSTHYLPPNVLFLFLSIVALGFHFISQVIITIFSTSTSITYTITPDIITSSGGSSTNATYWALAVCQALALHILPYAKCFTYITFLKIEIQLIYNIILV